jgi:D-glycero-alpha-D-manno-heptose-7-phosphate kinase
MIISKTPYRVSLFGGGTDLPDYFKKNGGTSIGFTIKHFCYIFLKKTSEIILNKYRIVYSEYEQCDSLKGIKHPSVRETLKFYNYNKGIELMHSGDLPAMSGMGSSSSFTVGLCNIIKNLQGKVFDKYDLAYDAINIEQNIIKEAVGSQDQVFAAFGGFKKINFLKNGQVNVESINLTKKNIQLIENSSFLVFTGKSRTADSIEKKKIKEINKNEIKQRSLRIFSNYVTQCKEILLGDKIDVSLIGKLLDETWQIKKSLLKEISNEKLNTIYDNVIKLGAYGGKLLGAGGGGFFFFLCDPNKKQNILKKIKLKTQNIRIDYEGSKIIYNQNFII